MLDWPEVHVVQMARIISLVPNSMLPKTPLPDATLHPQRARQGRLQPRPASLALGYSPLALAFTLRTDEAPPCTKRILIAFCAIGESHRPLVVGLSCS